ncbi:MAG: hypothetical protein ABSE95_02790 [Thermodesulfobacteriota bacterium]|jgi:hypothetical protein
MKKLLVIADVGASSVDAGNFLNSATGSQQIPSDVTRLAANSWLIDAHTSLPFVASLVIAAKQNGKQLVVLPIHDEELIYVLPKTS